MYWNRTSIPRTENVLERSTCRTNPGIHRTGIVLASYWHRTGPWYISYYYRTPDPGIYRTGVVPDPGIPYGANYKGPL